MISIIDYYSIPGLAAFSSFFSYYLYSRGCAMLTSGYWC